MTITKEIPSEQMRGLDLHQGDRLHVVAETESTLWIQIVKATTQPPTPGTTRTGRAGEWVRKYAGAARGTGMEPTNDLRMAHLQEKHGL